MIEVAGEEGAGVEEGFEDEMVNVPDSRHAEIGWGNMTGYGGNRVFGL